MSRVFTCYSCNKVWSTSTKVVDKEQEYYDLYGECVTASTEELVSVCDKCYSLVLELYGK